LRRCRVRKAALNAFLASASRSERDNARERSAVIVQSAQVGATQPEGEELDQGRPV
jgi:hypothetical protein